jgi:hypothetical protein
MQKHLEEVLKATGLPEDQVKALVELPENAPDFKTDTYVAPIHTTVETKVKNDPKFYEGLNKENLPKDFLKTLESEQYGRAAAILRTNVLKGSGLTEKDFEALGDEGKKMEIFTPAFIKKVTEGKVTDKELQQKLIDAHKELEELKTGQPELEKKYQSAADAKIADYQVSTAVLTTLASVQGLKAPAKYLNADIVRQLRTKYSFAISDGNVEIRQKDKPDLKVLVDNKELTLAGAIGQILDADGLLDKKTTTKVETKVDGDGKNGLKISSNVDDKIKKRIAEDAKAAGQ